MKEKKFTWETLNLSNTFSSKSMWKLLFGYCQNINTSNKWFVINDEEQLGLPDITKEDGKR